MTLDALWHTCRRSLREAVYGPSLWPQQKCSYTVHVYPDQGIGDAYDARLLPQGRQVGPGKSSRR